MSASAAHVERTQEEENEQYQQRQLEVQLQGEEGHRSASPKDGLVLDSARNSRGNREKDSARNTRGNREKDYPTLQQTERNEGGIEARNEAQDGEAGNLIADQVIAGNVVNPRQKVHHDVATFDFIGMTQALFSSRQITRVVMILFYTNIFLVLGDYILVMSHAVSALVGEENICIPKAGIIAAVLMYGFSQIRTMASLGRAATVISLTSLFVVVVQCLWAVRVNKAEAYVEASAEDFDEDHGLLRKLSALGSIGFAVSSQKVGSAT